MSRRAQALLLYDALSIEGGLLPPEWLARVASLEAPAQRPADYDVPRGLELRDEITRYWRMAQALWLDWASARSARPESTAATEHFVEQILGQVFGFADLERGGVREAAGRCFRIDLEAAGGNVPILVADSGTSIDASTDRHGDEVRRRSAWGALQEYLNAADIALWGIATNGLVLRIGRDNASMTRPAWIQADLERIFEEDRFADFSVLWLLLHASRFGRAGSPPSECPLEKWRDAAHEAGTRAREQLRDGVEAALLALGGGFLAHRDNTALREALRTGELTAGEYFNELLRLAYRMIFLLTVEEREILHPPGSSAEARALYAGGYGMRRLRERSLRRAQRDRHGDLWASLRPVFAALGREGGEPALGLPELGGLFAPGQCPHLDDAALENRALLDAVFRLTWMRQDGGLARVNWKDMGPEELGSVYESLLELVPVIGADARSFEFAGADESAGNARKLTGSYYTPDVLVQQLLDTALEPVVAARLAEAGEDAEAALLSITVLDPACGSGHFLLAAARRLAGHLARVRSGGTPGAHEYREALRDVVTHCIHGVDRNPMALELARMALWLEAHTPDHALGFLDHHLVLGDALVGLLDLSVLKDGIPKEAYKVLTGDDREVAKLLAKLNRQGLKVLEKLRKSENLSLDFGAGGLAEAFARLDQLADDDLGGVEAKRRRYEELRADAERSPIAIAADLLVGAFLMPKRQTDGAPLTESSAAERYPLTGALIDALEGVLDTDHPLVVAVRKVRDDARVLHWPLAFPQVFARCGFDVVVGNPPWEMLQLSEEEFFASRAPEIATLPGARRKAAIEALANDAPVLSGHFVDEKFRYEAANTFMRSNERFAHTAHGKLNTYALFAETAYRLTSRGGRAGLVVPTGIATDDSTKQFFSEIVQSARLVSLFDFENRDGVFLGVHRSYKFCLLTLGTSDAPEFAFFLTKPEHLRDRRRFFYLSADDFRLLNPNTRTCPVFRTEFDAELTKKIYRRVPVLIDENDEHGGNPWGISFSQGLFNMTSDSQLFLDQPDADTLPLYEAKMIHQFDHRWATYESNGDVVKALDVTDAEKADPTFVVSPRYWVKSADVVERVARVPPSLLEALEGGDAGEVRRAFARWLRRPIADWALEARRIALLTRIAAEAQTLGADEASSEVARGDAKYSLTAKDLDLLESCATVEEMVERILSARTPQWLMGWRDIARATDERTVIASVIPLAGVGDTLLLMFPEVEPRRLAALLGEQCSLVHDFVARQKIGGTHLKYHMKKQLTNRPPAAYNDTDLDFIVPRVLELTYTAEDLRPWAEDLGYDCPPFRWDPERRAILRAELDAYYARLYGLTRDELRYVLDPADVMGPDFPSETFRVLKENEERKFGEYRTRRLVLEAWDRLEAGDL